MIETHPSSADVTVVVTADLMHLCPFVDERDEGQVTITYRATGRLIELHALRGWLDEFKDTSLPHENITDVIRHNLSTIAGIDLLSVETKWLTAGMEVACSTSPTLPNPSESETP